MRCKDIPKFLQLVTLFLISFNVVKLLCAVTSFLTNQTPRNYLTHTTETTKNRHTGPALRADAYKNLSSNKHSVLNSFYLYLHPLSQLNPRKAYIV